MVYVRGQKGSKWKQLKKKKVYQVLPAKAEVRGADGVRGDSYELNYHNDSCQEPKFSESFTTYYLHFGKRMKEY